MTRIVSMQLTLALLLSIALHAALIVAPELLVAKQRPLARPRVEARLLPPTTPAETMAEAVSTEAMTEAPPLPPPTANPRVLRGQSLRRAQTALSEHLFYPSQAVAQGLEGDVILLLTLAENGQLVSASIARSSGHGLLDQAALDAARRIGALPGNPRQTLFPVRFSLQ